MSPPHEEAAFRDWVARHLDPLDAHPAAIGRSDFDLSPGQTPAEAAVLTPAAVLVGLVTREHGLSVILTRRSDALRSHTGQIALPGGRCEPGEMPWVAALREAHEEIGLDPALVSVAGLSTPYRTGTGFHVVPVVGFVAAGYEPKPNPDEVAEVFETPFGFLMDPASYEQREMRTADGVRRRFYAATWEDRTIWGATAGMLRALYDRLYGAAVA
ncbi:MAG TPA: CoA pyrophosphatase [Caulobacteraceae bacterium]